MISANKLSGGRVTLEGQLISINEKNLELTQKQAQLMSLLMSSSGVSVSIESLKESIGYRPDTETTAVQTAIYRIRSRLKSIGEEDLMVTKEDGYALAIE